MAEITDYQQAVAALCVELWRLSEAFDRANQSLADDAARRLDAKTRFARRQLDAIMASVDLSVHKFDGELFQPGMPVKADNLDDYESGEALIVVKTLEPTITQAMRTVHLGRVLLGPRDTSEGDRNVSWD